MQDSSIVHQIDTNIEEMLNFLNINHEFAAVNLIKKTTPWFTLEDKHISNGCIMAKKIVWENADFTPKENQACTCWAFSKCVQRFGKHRYLDLNDKRIKIIRR